MKQSDTTIPVKRGRRRKKHGGGRPSKFSHDLGVSLCELLKKATSRKDACSLLGISYQTMYNWLKKGESEKKLLKSRRTEFFNFWVSVNKIEANIETLGKYDDSSNSSDLTKKESPENAGFLQRENALVIPPDLPNRPAPKPASIESIVQYQLGIIQRTVINNPFINEIPTKKQAVFLALGIPMAKISNQNTNLGPSEVFFHGPIHTGKTHGLIMAALQYVSNSKYRALLLCSDYDSVFTSLTRSVHGMFGKTRLNLNGEDAVTLKFRSGAKLSLGYLHEREDGRMFNFEYYQFIGCDDLTSFTEEEYVKLFSYVHLPAPKSQIPLRIFSTGNASGLHPEWVKERFITPSLYENEKQNRFAVSVSLDENPHINPNFYRKLPAAEDLLMRVQLLENDWDSIDQPL